MLEDRRRSIAVLPWLDTGHGSITFGAISAARWSTVAHELTAEERARAGEILGSYRTLRDQEVDVTVTWFSDRSPVAPLDESDFDRMRSHVFLLGVAAISANTYMHHRGRANATHFARVMHNFVLGDETIALIARERDGQTISGGWHPAELRFVEPVATMNRVIPEWPRSFMPALSDCVSGSDSLSIRVLQSAVPFLQGNQLNEYSTPEQDIVWLASAIEQLLGVPRTRDKVGALVRMLRDVLSPFMDADGLRNIRAWCEEFYARRNEIHGVPTKRRAWPSFAHALLATVVYVSALKALLADAGRYGMTDAEKAEAGALPGRIQCVRQANMDAASQTETAAAWHRARSVASYGVANLAARALIAEFDAGDSPDSI